MPGICVQTLFSYCWQLFYRKEEYELALILKHRGTLQCNVCVLHREVPRALGFNGGSYSRLYSKNHIILGMLLLYMK